ncbi:hypothetical protein EHQ19_19065 [Leptospira montravelensis]|uniref:hypothetical protein n=1 Tax=Leptospira montravelensis TaxID=2484961 RepID=UPI0010843D0B|nr:hypothetical protein [Leptospira montravelensis]TGK77527.1 hypothetical protein EHQ19_19065 [Leptospira montravelensis]
MINKYFSIIILTASIPFGNKLYSYENCNDGNIFFLKGNMDKNRKSWNKIIDSNHNSTQNLLREVNKFKETNGIPIYSYKGRFLPKNYIEYTEPPCGSEIITFEKKLNKSSNITLNKIYEVQNDGKVINIWFIPVNTSIIGISQNSLMLEYEINKLCYFDPLFEKFLMRIQVNGEFEILKNNDNHYEKLQKDFSCKTIKINAESQYRQCKILFDLKTNKERKLIFDAQCT